LRISGEPCRRSIGGQLGAAVFRRALKLHQRCTCADDQHVFVAPDLPQLRQPREAHDDLRIADTLIHLDAHIRPAGDDDAGGVVRLEFRRVCDRRRFEKRLAVGVDEGWLALRRRHRFDERSRGIQLVYSL
jgi:hypothetical protein